MKLPAAFLMLAVVAAPRGTAELELDEVAISVDYGRPRLNGRDMADLLPVGHVWRLGADQATTFATSHDVMLGDAAIPAGAYSLFLKRTGVQQWALVLNTETGQWGTQHDVTMDFAEVTMTMSRSDTATEILTLELNAREDRRGELAIRWGEHVLTAGLDPRP